MAKYTFVVPLNTIIWFCEEKSEMGGSVSSTDICKEFGLSKDDAAETMKHMVEELDRWKFVSADEPTIVRDYEIQYRWAP